MGNQPESSSYLKKRTTKQIHALNRTREIPKGFGKTLLWLHDIRSMHNVGSAFRSADAFGVQGIILSGYTPTPPRAEISKTALGADELVDWKHFHTTDEVFEFLKSEKYSCIALEQTTKSVLIHELPSLSGKPVCLIFGNEVHGVSDEILARSNYIAEIPQYGEKHSFNISVAVGIALYAIHENYRLSRK